jgi:hypothetical protein
MCLYWHVYMGEVPEMCEPDENGYSAPALAILIYGESLMRPVEVQERMPTTKTMGNSEVPYVTSFDHDPSEKELALFRPEGYEE